MVYLQVILKVAGRVDLVEKVIEFFREMGNTLYFYPATAEPENGYKYVKMHVHGKDFSNCTSQYIEDLRNRLSRVLFVPNQYVVIVWIEPSSSLLITFMVPAKYVELMERRLIGGDTYSELHVLGIDIIQIGEKAFNWTN
ncbi:hypothetical protein DPMN_180997 [Dreissena polymorpha]|uniref:Uncharacterized protein n=1 Tax=Dreissena polymorpha TaxID=45954 RepID=A0A9D4I3X5_DREPO|nr:hypothetical protein DPMN_180997 [Dreissena polymorpha]